MKLSTPHTCPMCGGASHPATGCAYTATFVVCWRCTLEFARYLQRWTNMKGRRRGVCFYDQVGPQNAAMPRHP